MSGGVFSTLASRLVPQDEITLGHRPDVTPWTKFGYRSNLAAASGDQLIIADGVTNAPTILTSASTFTITYDGTGGGSTDGSGTTGATSITIYYLDSNGEDAVGTHVLGTDGSDVTSFSGLGINRAVVSTTGTLTYNASDINITATTGGSVQAFIPATQSVTQQAWFHLATNRIGAAKFLFFGANKLAGSNPVILLKGYVYSRLVNTRFEIFRYSLDTQSVNELRILEPVNFRLTQGDVLYFTGDTDRDNTVVQCRFSMNTYADS